jgi:uncharacterized protein (DUF1501 family)
MPLTRRDFLKGGFACALLGSAAPSVLVRTIYAEPTPEVQAMQAQLGLKPRTLVVLQLGGGNDGLSMLPPYEDGLYHDLRRELSFDLESGVIPLQDGIGLHPGLAQLEPVWARGDLAFIQNVGYADPNRSHFRSMDIWHTAEPNDLIAEGWLGRYLDFTSANDGNHWRAVHRIVAWEALHGYAGARTGSQPLLSQAGLEAYASTLTLQGAAAAYTPMATYPDQNPLAAGLQVVAQVVDAGLGTGIGYVSMAGFDTHAVQDETHSELLQQVADALVAFLDDIDAHGHGDDVVVMGFSEFGRRVEVNGSEGTDHGTAGPVLLAGRPVLGGLYGAPPDLSDLDNGDLKFSTDFRSVYATLLEDWLGTAAAPVLFGDFGTLPLLSA